MNTFIVGSQVPVFGTSVLPMGRYQADQAIGRAVDRRHLEYPVFDYCQTIGPQLRCPDCGSRRRYDLDCACGNQDMRRLTAALERASRTLSQRAERAFVTQARAVDDAVDAVAFAASSWASTDKYMRVRYPIARGVCPDCAARVLLGAETCVCGYSTPYYECACDLAAGDMLSVIQSVGEPTRIHVVGSGFRHGTVSAPV